MNAPTIKQPNAFLPLAMSLVALGMVLVHAAIVGIVYEADEGTLAHIFQLLIAAQIPIIAYFAIKWLPRAPWRAAQILALQAGAILAAVVAVALLT